MHAVLCTNINFWYLILQNASLKDILDGSAQPTTNTLFQVIAISERHQVTNNDQTQVEYVTCGKPVYGSSHIDDLLPNRGYSCKNFKLFGQNLSIRESATLGRGGTIACTPRAIEKATRIVHPPSADCDFDDQV